MVPLNLIYYFLKLQDLIYYFENYKIYFVESHKFQGLKYNLSFIDHEVWILKSGAWDLESVGVVVVKTYKMYASI